MQKKLPMSQGQKAVTVKKNKIGEEPLCQRVIVEQQVREEPKAESKTEPGIKMRWKTNVQQYDFYGQVSKAS
jgi:hypothetical protein